VPFRRTSAQVGLQVGCWTAVTTTGGNKTGWREHLLYVSGIGMILLSVHRVHPETRIIVRDQGARATKKPPKKIGDKLRVSRYVSIFRQRSNAGIGQKTFPGGQYLGKGPPSVVRAKRNNLKVDKLAKSIEMAKYLYPFWGEKFDIKGVVYFCD
jgi:hypothetical protein